MSSTRLNSLTSIRGLAALHVVLFHLWGRGELRFVSVSATNVVATGYLGVSLFFVLSGFVLIYTYRPPYENGKVDAIKFWRARFARVYPLYAFSLLISAPLYFGHTTLSKLGVVGHIVVQVFMLQAWDFSRFGGWNFPSWSLSAEAFFYLLFPVIGAWMSRKSTKTVVVIAVAVWALSLAPSIQGDASIQFLPILRLAEFVLGIATGLVFLRGVSTKLGAGLGIGGILLITLAIASRTDLSDSILRGGLLAPCFAALILSLALFGGTLRVFEASTMVLLGEASYGIYIFHIPVDDWLMFAQVRCGFHTSMFVYAATYLTVLILLSICTYKLVEIPARRYLLSWSMQASTASVNQNVRKSSVSVH